MARQQYQFLKAWNATMGGAYFLIRDVCAMVCVLRCILRLSHTCASVMHVRIYIYIYVCVCGAVCHVSALAEFVSVAVYSVCVLNRCKPVGL
jgi:hypothetical protein